MFGLGHGAVRCNRVSLECVLRLDFGFLVSNTQRFGSRLRAELVNVLYEVVITAVFGGFARAGCLGNCSHFVLVGYE